MKELITIKTVRILAVMAACFAFVMGLLMPQLNAQGVDIHIPDLAGIWDGTPRVRPVNGETVPWGENNFPDLNARARAYQEVWEEIMAPKYDCQQPLHLPFNMTHIICS